MRLNRRWWYTTARGLTPTLAPQVKIDWFMIKTYDAQPLEQQRRWIKFSSTPRHPAKFGSHTWIGRPPCGNFAWRDALPRLQCERDAPTGGLSVLPQGAAGSGAAEQPAVRRMGGAGRAGGIRAVEVPGRGGGEEEDLGVPVSGVGLAYQNLCKEVPEKLEAWRA